MLNWAAELAFIKNPRPSQEDNSVRKNFSQKVSGTRHASDDAVESRLLCRKYSCVRRELAANSGERGGPARAGPVIVQRLLPPRGETPRNL